MAKVIVNGTLVPEKKTETTPAVTRINNANSKKRTASQKSHSNLNWIVPALLGLILFVVVMMWHPWNVVPLVVAPTEAPVIETEAPAVVEAPVVVDPTEAPTEAPVVVDEPVVAPSTQTCPDTTEQAKQLFGVDVQRIGTEACGWVWRGKPESHSAVCPQGYICTWDVVDDVTVVHLGINQTANIYAGTWRLINAYPVGDTVYDTCALYAKEKDFGQREIPSFEVRFQAVPDLGPQTCP